MNPQASTRREYAHFHAITTRWMDNDTYGHVNNAVYYSWFDTVVNQFLISNGALDPATSPTIGLVIESQCNYFAPVSFPEPVTAGLRVGRLGNSSVRYEVGIFRGDEDTAIAHGHFIHVYVDRTTRRPVQKLPGTLRSLLQTIDRSATEFMPSTEKK